MSVTPPTEVARPPRGGLAVKLFAILLLLGVVAILVTGILGYVRGRDALEAAIYNQLTAQRQSKTRQVENYFRSTADDLRLLAQTKMVADALRDFGHGLGIAGEEADADRLVLGAEPGDMGVMRRSGGTRIQRAIGARDGVQTEVGEKDGHGVEVGDLVAHEGDVLDGAHDGAPVVWVRSNEGRRPSLRRAWGRDEAESARARATAPMRRACSTGT